MKRLSIVSLSLIVGLMVALSAGEALAVRTSVTTSVVTPKGPYPGTVAANALDVATFDLDNTNGNVWVGTGRELLVIQNPTAGAITVTLTSSADAQNRKGDITTYSLGVGEFMAFWYGNLVGWNQGGGQVYLDCSASGLKGLIFKIP
ncbi:MAG TPA: hypothetical protein PKN47_01575 [Nitrospira sp.]|nr:hypothetical protein [Nitrospira sp.]